MGQRIHAVGETKFDMVFEDNDVVGGGPNLRGFSASMSGLNLFDFVQMECLAGTRRAIRVTSGNKIGYLFFSGGTVTHALTPDAFGEAAALQILKWRDGTLDQCALHPDEQARIRRPWQQLLLGAAQQQDESNRDNLVEFPRQKANTPPAPKPESAPEPTPSSSTRESTFPAAERDGVIGAVRMDPTGEVVAARGQSEELPGLAGYALRLAELVGGSLGIEQVKTIDARLAHTRYAIKKGGNGAVIAVRALTNESPPVDAAVQAPPTLTASEVKERLSGLKDVEGVFGSFLIDSAGGVAGLDLPKLFSPQIVGEVGKRLMRLRESFETQGDELRSVELRYAQQRIYVRVCDSFLLGVLILGSANMALLGMAASVVTRQPRASTTPESVRATLPSLAPLPASAPVSHNGAGVRNASAPQGAPEAHGLGPRSQRPVYFRGRRVK